LAGRLRKVMTWGLRVVCSTSDCTNSNLISSAMMKWALLYPRG
jgi:hypothetical protein